MVNDDDPLLKKIHLEAGVGRKKSTWIGSIAIHYGIHRKVQLVTRDTYRTKELAIYQVKRIIKLIRCAEWHDIVDELDDPAYLLMGMNDD